MLAKIINNTPYCSKCNVPLANMNGEYRQVIVNGVSMTEFNRYCNSCRDVYTYQADIELDKTTRVAADKVEIIKESKGDTNVNDSDN